MSFATVQKTVQLIFSLFPFDAIVVYPNAKYRKKSAWGGLDYVYVKSLPPFCVSTLLPIVLFIIRKLLSYSRYVITVLYFHRKETFFSLIVHFTAAVNYLMRSK